MNFLFLFVHAVQNLLPLEVAITFGMILFALSWVRPRRTVSLPRTGRRTAALAWAGVAGSLLVVVVATAVSAIAATTYDASGFDGWWRRPAPLFAATLVVAVTAVALRRIPLPAPGERSIVPRRPWHAFSSRTVLWISGITAALLALTTVFARSTAASVRSERELTARLFTFILLGGLITTLGAV
jgi:hypothetical protein